MNYRINVIKGKILEEWKEITAENIWKAWNGWPSCVKKWWECDEKAIKYWKRVSGYYKYFKNYNYILNKIYE